METTTPVRKSHTSTADLLVWKETPPTESAAAGSGARPAIRTHQPAGGISKVLFGGQMTEEEAESVLKRKPCSGSKLREMTGSGIFAAGSENGDSEYGNNVFNSNRPSMRLYQQATNAISQISFNADEKVSPKKPVSLAEVAKQRELSGNLFSESENKLKKQTSVVKCKELSGHDIFGPPAEVSPKPSAPRTIIKESKDFGEPKPRLVHTSVKVSNPAGGPSNIMFSEEVTVKTAKKIYDQKFAELSGNGIFKGDAPPCSTDKPMSVAKLREMSGNDIFADGKAAPRDCLGGVRKPPGGESSIALV